MATKIKVSSLPSELQNLLEADRKKRGEMTEQERADELSSYLNKRKSAGTLPSGTLTNEEKMDYTKRDSDKVRNRALAEMAATAEENELVRKKSDSALSSPSMGEVQRGNGETQGNVVVPRNYTRNMPIASPVQSFISNRAREQEEEKLGTLAMAVRSGVNDVKSTGKTQYDLPTSTVPKTAKELEIQRQAGQYGITTTPATDEEIRLAKKYNVSVDDIRAARKIIGEEQRSAQNAQTVLPGITRPFTSEEIAQMNTEKKTSGGIKEVSDTITYTGAAFGLGAADTLKNTTSGIRTTVGDLTTGGAYSEGYKQIENYLSGGGMSGLAKDILYTTDENGKKMVAANWKDELSRALSDRTGVSTKVASAYIDTVETEAMLKLLGENVNDKYKETVGEGAYTIGQQLPGILLTMGYTNVGDDAAKFVADKVSKNAATTLIGTSVYGSAVNQLARERGYDPANYLNAALQGTVESALEKAFGFTDAASFKKFVTPTGSTGKTVLKSLVNYIGTGAEEGLEEAINVPASEIIDRMTGVSENTNWIGDGGIFDFKEMLKNGLSGAAVGMFMGSAAAISGITSAVQESKDIKTALRNLEHSIMTDLPDEYKPKKRITDASGMSLEDFYAYEAEVAEGYARYMNDIAAGKTDFSNAEGGAYTAKLSALEAAISSAESTNPETLAALVREIAGNTEGDKDAINKTVDFVRGEIQNMNNIIATTTDANIKQEATVNRQNYIDIDRTLRTYRKQINKALANLPAQAEAQVEPGVQAQTETVTETENTNRTVGETASAVGVTNPEAETAPTQGVSETSAQPVSVAETEAEQTVYSGENAADTVSAGAKEGVATVRESAADIVDEESQTAEETAERLAEEGYTFRQIRDQINAYRAENTAESNAAANRLEESERILVTKNRANVQKVANAYAPALKRFGINGVVVEDMPVGQNAAFDRKTNTIHLSSRISDSGAVGRFIVHEFTHRGTKIDMSLADSIVSAMESRKGGRGYISEAVIRDAYADQLSGLSAEEADSIVREERAAHFMERIMEDVNVLDEFRDDRTFLRKILDAIRDFFARNNPDKQEQIRLRNIEKKINDLLKAANVDEQVKAAGGVTRQADKGVRFSLDAPVEEVGELIAVHNLSEEKLKKVFDLGGFPMPSVAIVRAQDGHEGFGEVSVVFGKEVIDPKGSKSNKVYSADAWTPTYPTVEYKASEDAEQRITQKYNDLRSRFGDDARPLRRYTGDLSDELTRNGGAEGIIEHLQNDTDMMQLYLLDNGKDKVKPVEKETETVMSEDEQAMYQGFIDQIGEDAVRAIKAPDGEKPIEYRRKYISDHLEEIKNAYKGMLMEVFEYTSAEADSELETRKNSDYAPFMVRAEKFLRNGPKTVKTETDYAASKQAILDAVDMDGYTEWLDGLFNGAVEKTGLRNKQETFTASGKRRSWDALHYENTLENVVKAMKDSGEKGLGVFGDGNIFGAATREYKSVDDIKKDASKRLRKVSQEEYADMKQEFQDRLFEIAKRLSKNSDYRAMDDAMNILVEAVSKNKTPAKIDAYIKSESEGYANYSPEITADLLALVEDIRSMPTAYFEAKPQRAVGVSEIGAFVVPSDIKDSTRKLLDSTSAQVVEYERGDTESRLNALNSLNDLRFSRELDIGNHYDYSKSFAEQIDDYKAGDLPKYDTLVVGGTPEVFQKIGLNPLPMTYGTGHLEDVIKGNKPDHDFGVENLKKIPEALESPVAIFASNTRQNSSVVAVLDLSYNNKPMFAAVEIDGFGTLNGKLIDSNAITTIHTRANAANMLKNALEAHKNGNVSVFYVDKEKTADFLDTSGVQFPGLTSLTDGYVHSIHDPGSPVNTKLQSVTQTKQFKEWFGDWEKHPKNASKIVNEDGTPKVVYHGSNTEFSVFDLSQSGKNFGETSEGFFFFTNKKNAYPDSAEDYANSAAQRGGAAKVYEVYLDIKNPLRLDSRGYYTPTAYFDTNADDIYEQYLDGDYDGVIIENSDKSADDSAIYLVDDSSKIKSATDNIGTFDPDNPDIRYSRDIETPEQRHTRLMEENNEYLKKQFRAQTAFGWAKTVSPAQRNKFAGTIAADIPGVSAAEVSAAIKPVYDLFEKPKRGANDTPEVRFEEARKAAVEAAERLVDGAIQTEVNPLYEQYNDLRNFLRTTPIKRNVSVEEFGGAEAYSKWRNGNKGLLRVSDDPSARTIDQVYKKISEQYPEFFPEDITDLSEMLRRMGDVAVMLKAEAGNKIVRVNPLEDVRDSFVQDVASRILFGFDELARITPAAKYEYSAKVNERDVQQAYAEGSRDAAVREAQAYESGVKEGRRQNDREVQAARQREDIQYQIFQRDFNQAVNNFNLEIERQNKRIDALQTRIEKRGQQEQLAMAKKVVYGRLNRLNTMLTKPTRSKHIPQNLRAPVAKLLETIGTTRLPNGKTVSAETMRDIQEKEYARFEAESVRAADELETIIGANPSSGDNAVTKQFLDKLQENVRRLKEMYADINPNSPDDAVLPPDLAVTKQIEYVKQINKILAMTESYIKDSDTVFFAGKAVSAKEFSEQMISDLRGKTVPNETNHLRKFIHDVGYEFVSADLFFEMIGETGDEIMRQYRKAQTTQAKCEEEYAQYVLEKTGGKYSTNKVGYNGEKIDITVDGKNIKATRAQLMQLYMTWKRPAGRRHLRSGGAIFVNEAGVELSENTVLINDKTYNELVSYLTDEDKRIADALGSFMVRRCAEWGNDASMKMYGYWMFEDLNYFPMDVSNNVLPANWDSIDEFYRLENAGMTKSIKENASAPLRMTDIFDVADFHVRTMAAYTAYAPVSNDVQRILSMPGVNEAVNVGMGKKGAKYLETLVKTIASNKVRTGDMSDAARPLQFFMNAYKRQAVSFNISTALKQPLSIIRALNEIDAKYIAKVPLNISGSDYKRAYNAMIENSGVAKMKMLGYSDTGFGKSLRQIYDEGYINESGVIRGSFSKTKVGRVSVKVYDKITDAGMWAAGKMDEMTWVRLWRACELEVADRYKGLSAKEKTAKVAERFNEIIGRSQVVDTVLDTSPLMRNNAMALLTPFMNEPTKALATIITAADAKTDGKPNGKKKLIKAVGLVALNNLLLEPIVSSLMTMWRDEEDDTENIADFSKKFLKLYAGVDLDEGTSVTSVFTSNAVSGVLGSIPIIQIFYNAFADELLGFSSEKIDTAALSNLIRDTKNLIVNIQKAPVDRVETNYKLFGDFLGSAAAAIGIPLPTLRRQVSAMGRTILEHTDNYEAQWDYARFLYNLENGSARTQKQFYNIMAAAYKAGDVEAYRYMLNDLKNTQTGKKTIGVSWNKMKKYIEDRGGDYEIGSDLWLVGVQAEFNLPSFNPSMKVESSIAKIYKNALAEKVKNPGRALPSTPALYSYNKVDEDGNDVLDENGDPVKVEMTLAEYEDFIADVGRLSYNILLALQGQGQFKNLSAEEQVYCLDKAYDFAARYYRSKFNPDYNLSSGGKWMAEVAKGNLDTTKISRAILKAERNRD